MDKKQQYYSDCGIKKGWHTKTLTEFKNDVEAKEVVKNYLASPAKALKDGAGLYLWGANGTGKSHLMNCTFKELIDKGFTVRVFSLDEIVEKYTASWYSDEEKHELDNVLRKVHFLGIDEFGKNVDDKGLPVKLPDLVKRVMESVIRFRAQMQRPIWFASNTDPKFVKDVFSEDVASLLKEVVIPIHVRGEDYRDEVQKQLRKRYL